MTYGACMSSKRSTTVRLDAEDVAALERACADGLSSSDLIRRGLRLVAAKYYRGKRCPPSTTLFVATDRISGSKASSSMSSSADGSVSRSRHGWPATGARS